MIIIQEYAEKALTKRLEIIRKEAKPARCIHIRFASTDIPINTITPTIKHYIESNIETTEQTQLFICTDGDAYLIGHHIATKDIQFFLKYLGDTLEIDILTIATLYELPTKIHAVLTSVDTKIQQQDAQKISVETSNAQAKEHKKRSAILHVINKDTARSSIINTRKKRVKPQVMVIEDDAFTRQLVLNIMRKQYPIEGTGKPAEALSMYIKLAPNVLFLDINLPDVTGHELLERILEIDPNAYVVMLSGNADANNITAAMAKGAKGFVGKPFTKDKLLQYIDKCMAQSH